MKSSDPEIKWAQNGLTYTITTDKSKLDLQVIHQFLTNAYWAKGRTKETIQTCIENAICFGVYQDDSQIGFARVVSDGAIFAYIMDVFVLPEYRGRGISVKLMETLLNHSALCEVKKWLLATGDAHRLYAKFGFEALPNPQLMMGLENLNHPENNEKLDDPD